MDSSAVYFRLMLTALRNEGHQLNLKDSEAAQMIASALEILDPNDATEEEEAVAAAAPFFANSFEMLAEDVRELEAAE